jgi:hypothetical protein
LRRHRHCMSVLASLSALGESAAEELVPRWTHGPGGRSKAAIGLSGCQRLAISRG